MDDSSQTNPGEEKPQRRTKRKRGGQKGNRNACKHGLYAHTITPEEYLEYQDCVAQGIDPELAIIRIRLRKLLETDPLNSLARERIIRKLMQYMKAHYNVDKTNITFIKLAFENAINKYALDCAAKKSVSFPNFDGIL